VTVTLRDSTDAGQVHAEVRITLAANRAAFSVQPRLINGAERILPVQFWLSAALAPGGPSIEPDTRIILPVSQVLVHSRGENGWQLPGPRAPMPWPVVAGYNLSRYDQWADYLGFFIPYMQANFMAVYNPGADVGAARLVAPGQVPGHKFFAFGPRFGDRSYTDDGSQYVEIWGGANPSFWPEDDVQLAPGAALEWSESWWPLAGLGGLTFANQEVAFNLINDARLRILSVQPRQVTLVLRDEGGEIARVPMELSPTQPVEWTMPATAGPSMRVQFVAANGDMLAEYPIWQQPAETLP
jgi:hypothetical protein